MILRPRPVVENPPPDDPEPDPAKTEPMTKSVTVRMTEAMYAKVSGAAAQRGITRPEVCRASLRVMFPGVRIEE